MNLPIGGGAAAPSPQGSGFAPALSPGPVLTAAPVLSPVPVPVPVHASPVLSASGWSVNFTPATAAPSLAVPVLTPAQGQSPSSPGPSMTSSATRPTQSPSGGSLPSLGSSGGGSLRGAKPLDKLDIEMRAIYDAMDADSNGWISKLEFIAAVQNVPSVASFVLPGVTNTDLMKCEHTFDIVDNIFDAIAGGKQRIKYLDFAAYFRKRSSEMTSNAMEMRTIFDLIDADQSGKISKLELVAAVQNSSMIAAFLLPGVDTSKCLENEQTFDKVSRLFEHIACGKRRIDFADFEAHFKKVSSRPGPKPRAAIDRTSLRVFVIGPGFGQQLNPRQAWTVTQAGYQTYFCNSVPNPELPNFPVMSYIDQIKVEMDQFQPDIVACASKGGVYLVALWQAGYWRGPSLLINAHPACRQLPRGVPVVLCHGSNDEVYPTRREDLEQLIATASENQRLLYYVGSSGPLPTGQLTRAGDRHNMESLVLHDCLPRLLDGLVCPEGPEVHLVRSWRERLSDERLDAEQWLGYSPERLRKRWCARGLEDHKLFEVARGSEEFLNVVSCFRAAPKEPPAYLLSPQATWDRVPVLKVERVENGLQQDGSAGPYYEALQLTLEDQGLEFEPGVHTCWAFHGADDVAIESIVSNPDLGFQPLASGTRNSTLWGSGTYFARDAKYVADGGFCGRPGPDGSRKMLMCLLSVGMPCLGDPSHKGVLPFRNKPHRYNASVDSLSNPEIFIVQHPGAALPAYLITFM